MSTDFRALCAELAAELDHNRRCLLDDATLTHPLADRARYLLAEPADAPAAPPAEGEVAELIERLKYAKQNGCIPTGISWGLADGSTHHKNTFIAAEHGSDCGRAAELLERHAAMQSLAADAVSALRYIEQTAGRLYGVGWDRVFDAAATLLAERHAAPVPVPVAERLPGPEDCDAEGRCWLHGKVEGDWRLINPANSGVPHLRYCFSHWLPAHALPLPAPQGGEVEP